MQVAEYEGEILNGWRKCYKLALSPGISFNHGQAEQLKVRLLKLGRQGRSHFNCTIMRAGDGRELWLLSSNTFRPWLADALRRSLAEFGITEPIQYVTEGYAFTTSTAGAVTRRAID